MRSLSKENERPPEGPLACERECALLALTRLSVKPCRVFSLGKPIAG
jgi:hypothetical protein